MYLILYESEPKPRFWLCLVKQCQTCSNMLVSHVGHIPHSSSDSVNALRMTKPPTVWPMVWHTVPSFIQHMMTIRLQSGYHDVFKARIHDRFWIRLFGTSPGHEGSPMWRQGSFAHFETWNIVKSWWHWLSELQISDKGVLRSWNVTAQQRSENDHCPT